MKGFQVSEEHVCKHQGWKSMMSWKNCKETVWNGGLKYREERWINNKHYTGSSFKVKWAFYIVMRQLFVSKFWGFEDTSNGMQNLLLTLYSAITFGGASKTISGASHWTGVGCLQWKCLNPWNESFEWNANPGWEKKACVSFKLSHGLIIELQEWYISERNV